MATEFVHLHLHTEFALRAGGCRVGELLDRAAALKMPAVAVTEHGNLFSAVTFHDAARKRGVKPILGTLFTDADAVRDTAFHIMITYKTWQRVFAGASDVVGKTAFVAAFDMATGQLHWCSEPLVGNAHNFLVTREHIVSGYGFTAEPDHLFVLGRRLNDNGARDSGEPLEKGAFITTGALLAPNATDSRGLVTVGGLATYAPLTVGIDQTLYARIF